MAELNPIHFAGQALSFWPPHKNLRGDFNVLSGVPKITSEILHVMCVRPGEDPIHPQAGRAPLLFESLSNSTPHYFLFTNEQAISSQVAGIRQLSVNVVEPKEGQWRNSADVEVVFTPNYELTPHHLTFGYYAYEGPDYERFNNFVRDIHLDGEPFYGL